MLSRLTSFVLLPREVTSFERVYTQRSNQIATQLLLGAMPFPTAVAWWGGTGAPLVAALTAVVVLGAILASKGLANLRHGAVVLGIAHVLLAALLVHAGQGPWQGKMQFYFFIVLASLSIYGNPTVIIAATATTLVHHGLAWWIHPRSMAAVTAGPSAVALHVSFVILASLATCYIARIFFDNVIRLELKVLRRTQQLEQRERDVRLLLDSAVEGFLIMDVDGTIAGERSRVIDVWFGERKGMTTWFEVLGSVSPDFAERTRVAWQAVVDDFLPLELTLGQMPGNLSSSGRTYRVEYRAVSDPGAPLRALVVVTDVSAAIAEEALDADREEDLQLLAGILDDRAWMLGFLREAEAFARRVEVGDLDDVAAARALHTLKGNARMTGFARLAALCHDVEEAASTEARAATPAELAKVVARTLRLVRRARTIIDAAHETSGPQSLRRRLERVQEHARRAAAAAGKEVEVLIDDGRVRVDPEGWAPVWSNLVHGLQNAIDHGVESPEERVAAGKDRRARILLVARDRGDRIVLEIQDDGRGPAWDVIAARARDAGLPCDTEADLGAAVFEDGFSTSTRSTTSGRGVGLAALRDAVRSLGGSVALLGEANLGATLRIEVPLASQRGRRRSSGTIVQVDLTS